MADPRGESNSYGGYSGSGGGGYNNKSGGSVSGQGAQFQGNGNNGSAAKEAQRRNADMQAQIKAAEARSQMDEANARYEAQQAQVQAERLAYARQQNVLNPIKTTMGTENIGFTGGLGQSTVNGVPVTEQGIYGGNYPQQSLSQAMALGQDFSPRMPNTASGWMAMATNPLSIFGKALADESMLGMNGESRDTYLDNAREAARDPNNPWNSMTEAQKVSMSRQSQLDKQLPNAYIGGGQGRPNEAQLNAMRPENISESQWAGLPMEMKSSLAQSSGMMGGLGGGAGGGGNMMNSFLGGQLPELNMGMGRDYQPTGGTFKPITFRSGTGNPDPYAGLSDMAQQGQGMFNVAGQDALQAADQFNYNFDPQAAGQRLFDERSSLLEPAFAQQRAKNLEQMQGLGRIGLQLSGEGLGAGEDSGMMNPDMFGMNAAQSQALAGLSAQSTQDAFGQEVQRAGLDLNQFNTNQMTDQQRYANLMGTGQGMLTASTIEPEMRNQLIAQQQQQQLLDQNYALGVGQNETARIIGQAQANQANYQPDPWLSSLTSLGSSFLGTTGGSGWLSGIFGKART